MLTKYSAALGAMFSVMLQVGASASENTRILFSNPMARDSAAVPKLQGLKFVTVEGFAPFSAFDTGGTLRGLHVDLAKAICGELKITTGCTIQAVAFEDVESLLISQQADVALAGTVPNANNRKNLGFSVPYFRYPSKFLVKKSSTLKKGVTIGVVDKGVHQKIADALFPDFNRTTFTTVSDALAALNAGTISALFGDGLELAKLKSAGIDCCELSRENYFLPALRSDALSAATSVKRVDVLVSVNSALRKIEADGRLDEMYLRHMPINPLK